MLTRVKNNVGSFLSSNFISGVWKYLSCKDKFLVVVGSILSAASSVVKVLSPAALSKAIQAVASHNSAESPTEAPTYIIIWGMHFNPQQLMYLYVGLECLSHWLDLSAKYVTSSSDEAMPQEVETKLLEKTSRLAFHTYERSVSKLSLTIKDISNCASVCSLFAHQIIPCLTILTLGSYIVGDNYGVEYGAAIVAYAMGDGIVKNIIASKATKQATHESLSSEKFRRFYDSTFNAFSSMETIHAMNHSKFECDYLSEASREYHQQQLRVTRRRNCTNFLSYFLPIISRFLVVFSIIKDGFKENEINQTIFLVLYLSRVEAAMDGYFEAHRVFAKTGKVLKSVQEILALPEEEVPHVITVRVDPKEEEKKALLPENIVADKDLFHPLPEEQDAKIQGVPLVEFKNVTFGYKPNELVLENVTFKIYKGDSIGIIGRSGMGKSTISKLLFGFYVPNSGDIYFKGVNIKDIASLNLMRSDLGFLNAEVAIFRDESYLYNIMYGLKDEALLLRIRSKKPAELEQSAFVQQGKELLIRVGLGSKVNEILNPCQGLSTGEKQRIGIARLLLRDASILILDEPTSAMDVITEAEITEQIDTLADSKTRLVIAHRLSTLQNADRIFCVSNKGLMEEKGNHEERLRLGGIYATFWNASCRRKETNKKDVPAKTAVPRN